MAAASNASLFAVVEDDGTRLACMYKPIAGERPLWDFPSGTLALREVATYVLSAASGWDVVPPTVLRADGPFGPGSVQAWVGEDTAPTDTALGPDTAPHPVDVVGPGNVPPGWLHVLDAIDADGDPVSLVHADDQTLRHLAVLDVVANNADRKGGHILRGPGGRTLGIDHGLTFNTADKLRTVLWGWAGHPLPGDVLDTLRRLATDLDGPSALHDTLARLLTPDEIRRTAARARHLTRTRRHPAPSGTGPPIPWPPF